MRWLSTTILVLLGILIGLAFLARSPYLTAGWFKNPRVVYRPNRLMLTLPVPAAVTPSDSCRTILAAFMDLKRSHPSLALGWVASRHWQEVDKPSWYGVPLPAQIEVLPQSLQKKYPGLSLIRWEYGTLAEKVYHGEVGGEEEALKQLIVFGYEKGYSGQRLELFERVYLQNPWALTVSGWEKMPILLRTLLDPARIEKNLTPSPSAAKPTVVPHAAEEKTLPTAPATPTLPAAPEVQQL